MRSATAVASGVRVGLGSDGRFLNLSVADDGPGFDVARLDGEAGLGLAGMREQAELLGGDFVVQSHPGSGTETRVRWPLTRSRRLPWDPAPSPGDPDGRLAAISTDPWPATTGGGAR